jgi:penicillin-binding protein 1A
MSKDNNRLSGFKSRAKRMTKKSDTNKGVKVNRSVGDRIKAHKDDRARKRAEYLSTLPKNPIKRFFYRLQPKRLYKYWFSREGGIMALKVLGIGFAVIMVLTLATFAYFRKDLPKNITDLKTCSQGASTTYYDRTGQTLLWASSGDVECYPVKFEQISPYLRNAVVASEDKDFYKHGGFSAQGLLRAGLNNIKGGSTQGGSTITQQFVKNSLLTQDQKISRKIKELILSIELERSYSKDEILNAYLNEISFGSTYNGAEAAARGYFNKSAKDLTLDEAALLTAIIPAPTYYSPYGRHTDELVQRQHYKLDQMVDQGYIKKSDADAAKKVDTLAKLSTSRNKYKNIIAPYFVLEVQEQLEAKYGVNNVQRQGYKVITTLDLRLQKIAEDVVANTMPKVIRNNADNMAVVAEDAQTGQVIALVGGRGFDYPGYGQKNMATTPRSPGSTMKPYDYSSLMTQNKSWGAGSTLFDLKTDFGGYSPDDYDLRQPGAMSMRQALGGSRNIPAIKATYIAGVQNTIDLAKKMGVVSGTSCEPNCGLSAAIGDGSEIRLDEHVNGYATLARGGKYKPKTYMLKVSDARDKVLYEWKDTAGEQVLDPQIAYIVADMMSDSKVSYFGNNYRLNNGWKSALKTGTTNNKDNGWLMGYTNKLVFGLWMGRQNDNKAQYNFTDTILGPAWNSFMTQSNSVLGYNKGSGWTKPAGIKTVCINQTTGYATTSGGNCDIFPSWYQPQYPDSSKSATIDSVSKKLATECTPELAKQAITGGGIRSELPTSDAMYNNWIKPIQARYGGSGGGAIPTDKDDVHTCDPADKPSISNLTITPAGAGSYKISVTVSQGKSPLTTVNFKANGTIIDGGSVTITAGGTYDVTYTPTGSDPVQITAQVIDSVLYDSTTDAKQIP